MDTNDDAFFSETADTADAARELATEAIRRLLIWMADAPTLEDRGLSIRQSYFRLGIATEPKSRVQSFCVPPLPAHLRHAGRLLVALQVHRESGLTAAKRALLQENLRPIYVKLRKLFEPANSSARAGVAISH